MLCAAHWLNASNIVASTGHCVYFYDYPHNSSHCRFVFDAILKYHLWYNNAHNTKANGTETLCSIQTDECNVKFWQFSTQTFIWPIKTASLTRISSLSHSLFYSTGIFIAYPVLYCFHPISCFEHKNVPLNGCTVSVAPLLHCVIMSYCYCPTANISTKF